MIKTKPEVYFAENPDRIPTPWRHDVEEGIRQALVSFPGPKWTVTEREPADRTLYVLSFEADGREIGTLELPAEDVHLTPGEGPSGQKVQAAVREGVVTFLAQRA